MTIKTFQMIEAIRDL